jgi:hypothetical protein
LNGTGGNREPDEHPTITPSREAPFTGRTECSPTPPQGINYPSTRQDLRKMGNFFQFTRQISRQERSTDPSEQGIRAQG